MDKPNDNTKNLPEMLIDVIRFDVAEPYLTKRKEALWLSKKSNIDQLVLLKSNRLNIERTSEDWKKIEPLEKSDLAGKIIYSRMFETDSKITDLSSDRHLLDYLADWKGFLTLNDMGESEDMSVEYVHRRARIIGALKSMEDLWISGRDKQPTEIEWKDFYKKTFSFFDVKLNDEKSDLEALWINTYIVYYSAAWSYKDITAFGERKDITDDELKFRGLVGMVLELDRNKRKNLLNRMEKLDESTNMELLGLNLISTEMRVAIDNLETFDSLNPK